MLPRGEEWEPDADEWAFEGDGWQMFVSAPEKDADAVPAELAALVPGLTFRIDIVVEPIDPPADAWDLVRQTLESLGRALGGAGLDPDSGAAVSWGG